MTKPELIDLVENEMTMGGSLQIEVNRDYIDYLITRELNYAYMELRDFVLPCHAFIPRSEFMKTDFLTNRYIQFPTCVYGIEQFAEITNGGNKFFGLNAPDLGMNKIFFSDAYLAQNYFTGDWLTYTTTALSAFDQLQTFLSKDIRFRFAQSSHRLYVEGKNPTRDVWVTALRSIPEDEAYDHPFFQKLIMGRAMVSFNRSVKFFDGNLLVGGVAISTVMKDDGEKLLEEFKEWRDKGSDMPDWFLMFN